MSYADNTDYQTYLNGKKAVITTAFDYYAAKATQVIKRYTLNNIDESNIPLIVKSCCCEVAEVLYKADLNDNSGKTAETVGELSVSYESSETSTVKVKSQIKDVVYSWLSGSGLLYRGLR